MAKPVRKPPSPSDSKDPRATEYFFADLYEQHRMVGSRTYDLPSISGGAQATFDITVAGALPDKQMTVDGPSLPSTWNTGLTIDDAYISAADTVTVVVRNKTGGSIDMGSATYSVRVRP